MLCSCSDINESTRLGNLTSSTEVSSSDVTSVVADAPSGQSTEGSSVSDDTQSPVTDVQTTTVTTTPPPPPPSVSFTAVGDNLIHSSIYKQAARRAEELDHTDYDFGYAYEGVADLLDDADISIINQETLICNDEFPPDTYPCFNSPTELGDHMDKLGFDIFGMANNHVLDKGEKGLEACLRYYDRREMIRVGAYRDEKDRSKIRIVEKNGMRIAFLAYTEHTNGLSLPGDSPLCYGSIRNEDAIELALSEVEKAEQMSDAVIVMLHWGVEDSDVIGPEQRALALRFADAGTDVILGSHPHVLRDMEWIERSDGGRTLCAYSMGNFISAQNQGRNLIGGILDFTLTGTDNGNGERPEVGDIVFTPIVTHYDSNYSNIRLYTLDNYTEELANGHGVRANSTFSMDFILEYLNKHSLIGSEDEIVRVYSEE
ncbi:MAG: CapA family protein [Oscillospiraceae bacterium]|nr:CapA family protein [Oscillospiraceae bacterium]